MEQKPLPLLCQLDRTFGSKSNLSSVSEFTEIKIDNFVESSTFATTKKNIVRNLRQNMCLRSAGVYCAY
jgi:hypothetical protein